MTIDLKNWQPGMVALIMTQYDLRQSDIARACCVSGPAVSQWASGKKKPSRQSLAMLATALAKM